MSCNRIWGQRVLLSEGELLLFGGSNKWSVDEPGADSSYFYAGEGLSVFQGFYEADDGVFCGAVEGSSYGAGNTCYGCLGDVSLF